MNKKDNRNNKNKIKKFKKKRVRSYKSLGGMFLLKVEKEAKCRLQFWHTYPFVVRRRESCHVLCFLGHESRVISVYKE